MRGDEDPSVGGPTKDQRVLGSPPGETGRGPGTFDRNGISLGMTVAKGDEGDVLPVRGESRGAGGLTVIGETPRPPTRDRGEPEVVSGDECDQVLAKVRVSLVDRHEGTLTKPGKRA
jgi:hypothetical protein